MQSYISWGIVAGSVAKVSNIEVLLGKLLLPSTAYLKYFRKDLDMKLQLNTNLNNFPLANFSKLKPNKNVKIFIQIIVNNTNSYCIAVVLPIIY